MSLNLESTFKDEPAILLILNYLAKNPSNLIDIKKLSRTYSLSITKLEKIFTSLEINNIGRRIYQFSKLQESFILPNLFKFYFYDFELWKKVFDLQFRADQEGALIEQSFFNKINELDNFTIEFFRTNDGLEIDFIIYNQNDLFCIELKKDQFIYASDLEALLIFDEKFKYNQKLLVLHNGIRDNSEGKIKIRPMDKWIYEYQKNYI